MAIDALIHADWVLLPGTLCTAAIFEPMLDDLGIPEARRHAVELNAPDVNDYGFLGGMCRDAVVCGFSLGAIVAAHHAHQVDARRLLLFGLNPLADDPARAQGRRALADAVAQQGGSSALGPNLPEFAGPDPAAVRRKVLEMAQQTGNLIAAHTDLALSRPGALPALRKARCPVHVVTGTHDALAPPSLGRQAADAAPLGQFRALDPLGHYALLEDAAACANAVRDMEVTLAGTV